MLPQRVTLRPAQLADARALWEWRNEESMRRASFQSAPVPFEVHEAWLARVVRDPAIRLFVAAEPSGRDVGFMRFDLVDDGQRAEVSVCVDRAQRGRGLGTALILAGCESLWAEHPGVEIVALVKPENVASQAAFVAAGFVPTGTRADHSRDFLVQGFRRRPAAVR